MSKKTWVYIPDLDRAGYIEGSNDIGEIEVIAPTEHADIIARNHTVHASAMEMRFQQLPIIEVLQITFQAVVIIDKIMPFLVRWWKMLFGSEDEKAQAHLEHRAAKAVKRAKALIEMNDSI